MGRPEVVGGGPGGGGQGSYLILNPEDVVSTIWIGGKTITLNTLVSMFIILLWWRVNGHGQG